MDPRAHRRSLRNLLLDRRFQLKYAVGIALSGGLIFGGLGLMVDQKVRQNTALAAMGEAADPFEAELRSRMASDDAELRWTLLAFWLAVMALLFAIGILATHRVVGPVFVVERHLADLMAGRALQLRPLRQGDEFQALFRRVAALAQQLDGARAEEAALIERALATLKARVDAAEGPVSPETVRGWLGEDLGGLEALAARKRGEAPG